MLPQISKRAQKVQASPLRKLIPLAEAAKQQGKKVYHLNIGQPDLATPPEILAALKKNRGQTIAYAPSAGLPECLQAWEKYYQDSHINLSAQDIIITTGGSEALLLAIGIIADPQEEIIVSEPFYTNYHSFASLVGCHLIPLTTVSTNGYHLPDNKTISQKISPRTRGIIICNPNNPTGTVYHRKELQRLAQLAEKHNLFILADETYREFVFDSTARAISMLNFPEIEQRVIILDSVSKRFNACGLRIGCLASKNKAVIESALKYSQARLAVSTIDQLAVIPALENSQKIIKPIIAEYKKRRDVVYQYLQNIIGVKCLRPEGAFYAFPRLPIDNTENFARWLLQEYEYHQETLMIAPAPGFYATPKLGQQEIRIAYVLKSEDLVKAMIILKNAVNKYKTLHSEKMDN